MTWETISAIASAATFVVIAVSAAAALVQLRHLRTSNQMSAMFEYERLLLTEEFMQLRSELTRRARTWAEDRAAMERIYSRTGDEYRVVTTVANVFENIGAMVRYGMLERELTCALWSQIVLTTWETLAPITVLARRHIGSDGIWENFEYLAVLSKAYLDGHPNGRYPAGVPRFPLPRAK
jgi:hypothetical protein